MFKPSTSIRGTLDGIPSFIHSFVRIVLNLVKKLAYILFIAFGGLLSICSFLYLGYLSIFGFIIPFIAPYNFVGSILCFFVGIIFIKIGTKKARALIDSKYLISFATFLRWLLATPFLFYSLMSGTRFIHGIYNKEISSEYATYAYMFIVFILISCWILWSEIRWFVKKFS